MMLSRILERCDCQYRRSDNASIICCQGKEGILLRPNVSRSVVEAG